MQADAGEVVTIEGDIQMPKRIFQLEQLMQSLGDPNAAGVDADHQRPVDVALCEQAP